MWPSLLESFGLASALLIYDQPLKGFGYPIIKNANPRNGTVAESKTVDTNKTKITIGNINVY
jgi:hypothetical protein